VKLLNVIQIVYFVNFLHNVVVGCLHRIVTWSDK